MKQTFTSHQVAERTGLSPRQLQWWDEQGIVVPARLGHRRLYSATELAELVLLGDLRRRGFSLQRIRHMLVLLRHTFGHGLAELLTRRRAPYLLTDGETIFLCESEQGVIDLLRDSQQPLLALCVASDWQQRLAPTVSTGKPVPKKPARAAKSPRVTARGRAGGTKSWR